MRYAEYPPSPRLAGGRGLFLDPRGRRLRHAGADHSRRPRRDRDPLRRPLSAAPRGRPDRAPAGVARSSGRCSRRSASATSDAPGSPRSGSARRRRARWCAAARRRSPGRVVDLEALFGSTETLRERLALARDDRARVTAARAAGSPRSSAARPRARSTAPSPRSPAAPGTIDLVAVASGRRPEPAATRTPLPRRRRASRRRRSRGWSGSRRRCAGSPEDSRSRTSRSRAATTISRT